MCDVRAIDEMLAEVVDFPDAATSQESSPERLPMLDFHEALDALAADASPSAVRARCPAAAGYLAALADSRSANFVESRIEGADEHRERLSFAESRVHGLWLAHDDPHPDGELDGVMTRVQRVTVAMARDEAAALVDGAG